MDYGLDRILPSIQAYKHKELFRGVNFYFSPALDSKTRTTLSQLLTSLGAENVADEKEKEGFDLKQITHYFTEVLDKTEFDRLNALLKSEAEDTSDSEGPRLVTPFWITRSYDLESLQDRRYYSPSPAAVFSGVCICTSDLTPGDSEAIKAGVSALGGWWKNELTREVTHLIVLKPGTAKYERVMSTGQQYGMKAVLPHWIDDCLTVRSLLPTTEYEHPSPPLLHPASSATRPTPSSSAVQIDTVTHALERHLSSIKAYRFRTGHWGEDVERVNPNTSAGHDDRNLRATSAATGVAESVAELSPRPLRSTSSIMQPPRVPSGNDVLVGKKVYISSTVDIREGMLGAIESMVMSCAASRCTVGALLTDVKGRKKALEESDIVICWRREDWEFWTALEAKPAKTIGNLTWLYEICGNGVFRNPLEGLLLFPLPPNGLKKFKDYKFTVSNYTTICRDYVKRIIEALGGKFEGAMSKLTTHVIASKKHGKKVLHASDWGQPVINHLWLQECFLYWKEVHFANDPFTTFGDGLNDIHLMESKLLTSEAIQRWAEMEDVKKEREKALRFLRSAVEGIPMVVEESGVNPNPHDGALDGRVPSFVAEEGGSVRKKGKVYGSKRKDRLAESNGNMERKRRRNEDDSEEDEREKTPIASRDERAKKKRKPSRAEEFDDEVMLVDPPRPSVVEEKREDDVEMADGEKNKRGKKEKDELKLKPKQRVSRKKSIDEDADADDVIMEQKAKSSKKRKSVEGDEDVEESRSKTKTKVREKKTAASAPEEDVEDELSITAPLKKQSISKRTTKHKWAEDEEPDEADPIPVSRKGKKRAVSPQEEKDGKSDEKLVIKSKKAVVSRTEELRSSGKKKPEKSQDYSSFDAPPGKPREAPKVKVSHVSAAGKPIKICTTGVTLSADQTKALKGLKAKKTEDAAEATHLITNAISRTEKFLCALAQGGAYIVTEKWMNDSLKHKVWLEEDAYLLHDPDGEKKFKMNLKESLQKSQKGGFFKGKTVYITKNVKPDHAILSKIIKAAGGTVKTETPSLRIVQKLIDKDSFLISCEEDRALWDGLLQKHTGFCVYNSEFILMGALYQQLKDDKDFIVA